MLFTDPFALIRQAFNDRRSERLTYTGFADNVSGSLVVGLKATQNNLRYIMIKTQYKVYLTANKLSQFESRIVDLLESPSKRVLLAGILNKDCFCLTKYFMYPEYFRKSQEHIDSYYMPDDEYRRIVDMFNKYSNIQSNINGPRGPDGNL